MPERHKLKLIKNERSITISEDCAIILDNCQDVTVQDCAIFDAGRNAIYIRGNCSGIEIIKNVILRAGAVGIYLDSGSHSNYIHNNLIEDCGFWLSDRNHSKIKYDFSRFGLLKREGIAIDDSRNNIIDLNRIHGNALAGITLYRNCGEFCSYIRGEGSNDNTITSNEIEYSPVGIWNAARQYRDMWGWDCSDTGKLLPHSEIPEQPFQQYFNWSAFITSLSQKKFYNPFRNKGIYQVEDVAERNTVGYNEFYAVKHEIIDNSKEGLILL